jgi:hypothetical protein
MHWPMLVAAVALAVGYHQVGAMSVWVTVLSFTLKAVLLAIAAAVLVLGAIAFRRRLSK